MSIMMMRLRDQLESSKNPGALLNLGDKGKGANPSDYGHNTFRQEQGMDGSTETRIKVN